MGRRLGLLRRASWAAAAILAWGAPVAAQDEGRSAALERRLAEQEQELRRLSRELESLKGQGAGGPSEGDPARPSDEALPPSPSENLPERVPPERGGDDRAWVEEAEPDASRLRLGVFYVEDLERQWRLDISGRLQVDGRFVLDRDRDFDDSFLVRRGRLEFTGRLWELLVFDMGIEFGEGGADFRNAFLDLGIHEAFHVRAGQMLLPYSDERLMSSKHLTHPERSMFVANIVGDRDIGAMLHGSVLEERITYYLGAFNGEGQNVALDADDDFDLATRVELRPAERLLLSANYIYSPPNRTQSGPSDIMTVGDEFTTFLDYDDANRRLGERHRAGGAVTFAAGPFFTRAEVNIDYHLDVVSPAGARTDLLSWAWYLDAFVVLTGEALDLSWSGFTVEPRSPLYTPATRAFGPGAVAVGVRFEDLQADEAAVERGFAAGSARARAVSTSLHWYLWEQVRLTVSYTYTHFQDGVIDSEGDRFIDENALVTRFAFYF